MPELSIRKIIEKTLSGEIRIPSFQRGFVWEPEKVAFFIDSLYKGYPIGSLLFWRTNIRLENERQLGNYSLPEPTKGYPLDYVLDGQQRITSFRQNLLLFQPYQVGWIFIIFWEVQLRASKVSLSL